MAWAAGRTRDADRLGDVVHRVGRHHVGRGPGIGRDLQRVIVLGLGGIHQASLVAVAARPDGAADDARRRRRFPFGAQPFEQLDRRHVDCLERLGVVAELGAPVGIGTPAGAVEHEADLVVARDPEIALVVALQMLPACLGLEQDEGREMREIDAFVKDQRRLHAAVAEEDAVRELRKVVPVPGHDDRLHEMCANAADASASRLMQAVFRFFAEAR